MIVHGDQLATKAIGFIKDLVKIDWIGFYEQGILSQELLQSNVLTTLFNISSKSICSIISISPYFTGSIISGKSGRLIKEEIGSYSAILDKAEWYFSV